MLSKNAALTLSRRFARRRLLATAGAGALAAACGRSTNPGSKSQSGAAGPGATPKQGGTFTALLGGNPPTLDSQQTSSDFSFPIASASLSRILRFQTGMDVQ